jgi:hypothetical protein
MSPQGEPHAVIVEALTECLVPALAGYSPADIARDGNANNAPLPS